jgi:hypothetical protein
MPAPKRRNFWLLVLPMSVGKQGGERDKSFIGKSAAGSGRSSLGPLVGAPGDP